MKIADLMTKGAMTCSQTDTLDRAAEIMWEHDCGAVPVTDDRGRTVGIVTDRDICMAAYTQGKRLSEIPVSVAVSKSLVAAGPEDSVESVAELMQTHQIRRVPILDERYQPVGMFTVGDLARHATRVRKMDDLDADVIARTLAAISKPRRSHVRRERPASTRRPAARDLRGGTPETWAKKGPVFHVQSVNGGWVVFDREGQRVSEMQRAQSDGVVHAKELARRAGSAQIIVHREDGAIASEFFYQREERSGLASDDSTATMAASRPAHARTTPRPGR